MSGKPPDKKYIHRLGGNFFPNEKTLEDSMIAHEHIKFPNGKVTISLDGDHLFTILECLLKVHAALIREVGNDENSDLVKKKAYDFAYDTEVVYGLIMDDLKLHRPGREDLN